jgi:hypothetical protein
MNMFGRGGGVKNHLQIMSINDPYYFLRFFYTDSAEGMTTIDQYSEISKTSRGYSESCSNHSKLVMYVL